MYSLPTDEIRLVCLSAPLAFLFHVAVWRSIAPQKQVFWLVLALLVAPGFLFLLWRMTGISSDFLLVPAFTHFLIMVNYIAIYPAFQASSPTIQILNLLRKNQLGLSEEDIFKALAQDNLVKDRLSDLSNSGLISHEEGPMGLTLKGKALASIFVLYRKLLSLPEGAG